MNKYLLTTFVVLVGTFSLTAAAQELSYRDLGLIIAGERMEKFDPDQIDPKGDADNIMKHAAMGKVLRLLQNALDGSPYEALDLRNSNDRDKLRTVLDQIQAGTISRNQAPEAFRGLSGFSTMLGLRSAIDLLDKPPKRATMVKGRILDYVYDDGKKSGHLAVKMRIDHFDANGVLYRRQILHWDIDVEEGGYRVVPRDTADPNDPFPNTIGLPPESLNPMDRRSIWVRGLNHKLFAKGMKIKVRNIYEQINNGPITRLPDTNALYASTNDTCIDIMFAGRPPAMQLPPQIGYCLGRCAHPFIINSN